MIHPKTFSQAGLGFGYFSLVCISRDGDLSFGLQMHDLSKQLLAQHGDPYTLGRGLTLSALFIAHLCAPMQEHLDALEEAIGHSLVSGDKHLYLLSVGSIALRRLYVRCFSVTLLPLRNCFLICKTCYPPKFPTRKVSHIIICKRKR